MTIRTTRTSFSRTPRQAIEKSRSATPKSCETPRLGETATNTVQRARFSEHRSLSRASSGSMAPKLAGSGPAATGAVYRWLPCLGTRSSSPSPAPSSAAEHRPDPQAATGGSRTGDAAERRKRVPRHARDHAVALTGAPLPAPERTAGQSHDRHRDGDPVIRLELGDEVVE